MRTLLAALILAFAAPLAFARDFCGNEALAGNGLGMFAMLQRAMEHSVVTPDEVRAFATAVEWKNLFATASTHLLRPKYTAAFRALDAHLGDRERAQVRLHLLDALARLEENASVARAASAATADVLKAQAVQDFRFQIEGYQFMRLHETPMRTVEGRVVLVARYAPTDALGAIPGSRLETFLVDPANPDPGQRVRKEESSERVWEYTLRAGGDDFSVSLRDRILTVKNLSSGEEFKPMDYSNLGQLEGPPVLFRHGDHVFVGLTPKTRHGVYGHAVLDVRSSSQLVQGLGGSPLMQASEIAGQSCLCWNPGEAGRAQSDAGHSLTCLDVLSNVAREIPAQSLLSNVSSFRLHGHPALAWGGENSLTVYEADTGAEIVMRGEFGRVERVFAFEMDDEPYAFVAARERLPQLVRLSGRSRP